ncbi:hypothetical protein ACWGJ2_12565 [Streptomyces sp. NPDC054796]
MTEPSWDTIRPSEQLADTPAIRWDGRWWLTAPSGAVPADAALTRALERHVADLAAADRVVAALEHG